MSITTFPIATTAHGVVTDPDDIHESYHYVSGSDPGSVGAGKRWLYTGAVPYQPFRRNGTDTAWIAEAARAVHVDVRDKGAKGDGSTDDTQAFLDALAESTASQPVHVHIPPPLDHYKITDALDIPLSYGMTVSGGGKLATQIVQYSNNTPIFRSAENGNHSVTIRDLGLAWSSQQTSSHTDSYGVMFDHGASYSTQFGFVIEGLYIDKAYTGVGVKGTAAQQLPVWGMKIADSVIHHVSGYGVDVAAPVAAGTPNVTLRNLFITNTGGGPSPIGEAIRASAVDELLIDHCDIEGWTRRIIYVEGHNTPVLMTGGHFENNTWTDTTNVENLALFGNGGAIVMGCNFSGSITKGAIEFRVLAASTNGTLEVVGCGFNITIVSGTTTAMDASSGAILYERGNRQLTACTNWPINAALSGRADALYQHDRILRKPGPSADKGNAAATLTWITSPEVNVWNTALTADRAVTLSTTGAADGARFRIVRTAAATGAFNLNVGTGPLKALTAGQWCDVEYSGVTSAWMLVAAGSL